MLKNNLFKYLAKGKNFINRALGYIGILNALLIVLTFKKVYNIQINSIVIIIFGIIILLMVGIFDYYFILTHEYQHANKKNDLKKDILEIKELLKNGK